ncbi:hypothetical protein [Macrococcus hajekii]|nr:hypothetical protein [Macrococcus hajekii]
MTVLLIIMLLREYYRINTYLEVYRGFTRIKVDIMQIEMMNIAMYGSRPGVEISGNERQIIVFPVETELFVKTLLTINPDIYLQNQQNMDVLRCNF